MQRALPPIMSELADTLSCMPKLDIIGIQDIINNLNLFYNASDERNVACSPGIIKFK